MIGLLSMMALAGALPAPGPVTERFPPPYQISLSASANNRPIHVWFNVGTADTVGGSMAQKGPIDIGFSDGETIKANVKTTNNDWHAPDIVLGYDDLKNSAIGVDLIAETISFWPHGLSKPEEGEAWVKDVKPNWPTSDGVETLPLSSCQGLPSFAGKIDGKPVNLWILLDVYETRLPQDVAAADSGPTPLMRFAYGDELAGQPVPWLIHWPVPKGSDPAKVHPFDGTVSLDNLYSQKVLLDLKDMKCVRGKASPEGQMSWLLESLIYAGGVIVDGDHCTIGGSFMSADMAPYKGKPLSDIAGIPGDDIAHALKNPSDDSIKVLEKLRDATQKDYELHINFPDGSTWSWPISRPQPPAGGG